MNQRSTCLVTGGAGFLGSHLIDSLLAEGYRVKALDNLATGKLENIAQHLENDMFTFIEGSILNADDLATAMIDCSLVFHLACLGVRHSLNEPFENHRVNAEGTLRVLQSARQHSVQRVVYTSSSEVYGTAQYAPMPEKHPTYPATVYGSSKLAGEAYTRAFHSTYGLETVVIRPFNLYGPRSHHEGTAGELIPKSIVRVLSGRDILIFGDGSITRDFTFVRDTVRAIVTLANSEAAIGQTINVGSGKEFSLKEIATTILQLTDMPDAKISYSDARPGDVLRLCADITELNKLCDWSPTVTLKDGLTETIRFFSEHPLGIDSLAKEEVGASW